MRRAGQLAIAAACAGVGFACASKSTSSAPSSYLSADDLMDPGACSNCHPNHFKAWSGSMHAYASDDPIFVAMNARAQRETGGAVGTFCVKCHAPLAVAKGATTDGTNLATLAPALRGVGCYACHDAVAVGDTHNNGLTLALDQTLRASIPDPIDSTAHRPAYSPLFDRDRVDSASLCGSCHDVRNANGVDLERTYAEWKTSIFAHDVAADRLTCASCHMPGSDGTASNVVGSPPRRVHDHAMAGVDLALTPFPEADTQKALVQGSLDPAIVAKLCVDAPDGRKVDVTLDAGFVGHAWPSGATHDRRAWVELVGYANGASVFGSGVVADGQAVPTDDPSVWLFRERLLDASGKETHMLWQATKSEPAQLMPTVDPSAPAAQTRSYALPAGVDRVTVRVRIQPIGLDVADDLVASKDLSAGVRAALPTFTLAGTTLEWKMSSGYGCVP